MVALLFKEEFEDIKGIIRIKEEQTMQTTRDKDKYGKNTLKFTQKTISFQLDVVVLNDK